MSHGAPSSAKESRLAAAVARGLQAVRRNAKPFLLIQALAVALAIAYYLAPGAPSAMAGIAAFKRNGGLPLSAIATAFASVALPEFARWATGRDRTGPADLAFQIVFFSLIGIVVDLFYQGLGLLFGNDPGFVTIGKKLLVDQLAFSTVVTTPFAITAFLWKDSGFSPERTANAFRAQGGFWARYLQTIVPNWCYWPPVLVAVYAMPGNLQFLLFLFVQAAWSLILVDLNER